MSFSSSSPDPCSFPEVRFVPAQKDPSATVAKACRRKTSVPLELQFRAARTISFSTEGSFGTIGGSKASHKSLVSFCAAASLLRVSRMALNDGKGLDQLLGVRVVR